MDKTIMMLLVLCTVLFLVALGNGLEKDKLQKQLDATNKMVKSSCSCHPWR